MKINRKIVQLSLVSLGIFLILITYFLYPEVKESKLFYPKIDGDESLIENKSVEKNKLIEKEILKTDSEKSNMFENVEYKGIYDINKTFTVKSESAFILTEDPDIVYMSNMLVTLYMNDGKIVTITSDKGRYNKITYDCFFEKNVRATDENTTITADNLDLLTTADNVTVYNNVFLNNDEGWVKADKLNYDFETKYYQISMFNNKKVEVKLIK